MTLIQIFLGLAKTFKISDLIAHIQTIFREKTQYSCNICDDRGHSCEILQESGGGWQTGKIKISFELLTEVEDVEPIQEDLSLKKDEFSVLDELRQLNS
ncbi:KGK domain-containing protein [Altericista sp. CCNU0014]|uniref:KGK domain-containing protein n=1 Tax=Altericista sp. CCNU0014 TaxID=3082949 RepID=UPI00384F7ADD